MAGNKRRQSNEELEARLLALEESLAENYNVSAYKSGGAITADTTIALFTIVGNANLAFNATTGVYTVQKAGDYMFLGTVGFDSGTPLPYVSVNGVKTLGGNSAGGRATVGGVLRNLQVNDTVTLRAEASGTSNSSIFGTRFGMFRIK